VPTRRHFGRHQPLPVAAFDLKVYRHPKGYVRVSTDEQAEEGTSIDVQIRQIRHYADLYGFPLSESDIYIDDGWSGKDLNRPALTRLREDARAGLVDCVLVTKLDRFSRNLRDTVNLCLGEWQDEAEPGRHVALKSITEPFDTHTDFGRMVFGLLAMFAEFERRRIAERTWSGKMSRAEAGRNAGHRPAYGFRLVEAPEGKGSLFEVVPEEAEVIRRICDLYLQGMGDQQVARRLNEDGLRFRGGKLWMAQHVARILGNPLICGRYAYGRRTVGPGGATMQLPESEWVLSKDMAVPEPILPPDLFERIRQERSGRRSRGRRPAVFSLLSGLLRCGLCGSACGVKTCGPGAPYRYYRCLQRKQSGTIACTQPNIRADELDAQVEEALVAVLAASAGELSQMLRHQADLRRTELAERLKDLENQGRNLQRTKQNYYSWLERGELRPDAVQERLDDLDRALTALTRDSQRLKDEIADLTGPTDGAGNGGWQHNDVANAWTALPDRTKRRLAALLIREVSMEGPRVAITWRHRIHEILFLPQLTSGASITSRKRPPASSGGTSGALSHTRR
jgi:site-specific DNA recombinase